MVKKSNRGKDTDTPLQRAQRIAARNNRQGKTLISEDLIQDRRAEAKREHDLADTDATAALDRALDAMVRCMQNPASKNAFSTALNATPDALRESTVENRLHEATMYRMMKEPQPGVLLAILKIMDSWGLIMTERLAMLGCNQILYDEWVKDPELMILSDDTWLRISYLLGIWNALNTLFPDPEIARTWIHRPNSAMPFNGATPLNVMANGKKSDLLRVRQFLDGWCT
jgi:hypothetical protein